MALAVGTDSMEGIQVMASQKTYCCEEIVDTLSRVKSLEEWRDEYILSAQRWRDDHTTTSRREMNEIRDSLNDISKRLTTFVNPVISVVISALTLIVGILAGALWAAL